MCNEQEVMAQETQREVELRLSKLVVNDEQVIAMMKMAREHKIIVRVDYMVHHWYAQKDKTGFDLAVRTRFVDNMKHFILYFDKCLVFMDATSSKLVSILQLRVSPFNMAYYWCYHMYPYDLDKGEIIYTQKHMYWFAQHMFVSLNKRSRELTPPMDSDSESNPWNDDSDSEQ